MSNQLKKRVQRTLAFARYLSWADLQRTLFVEELERESSATAEAAAREHEWRWFGLLCYWYGSLHVAVEAWDELGFDDPVVDSLLSHPKQFRILLRRYRNAVFHYQASLIDPKIMGLLEQGVAHAAWIHSLHHEMIRFFNEHLASRMETDEQRSELRASIEAVVNWYPYRDSPQREALELTLSEAHELLDKYPNDRSQERRRVEQALTLGEAALDEGNRRWAKLRARLLKDAEVD